MDCVPSGLFGFQVHRHAPSLPVLHAARPQTAFDPWTCRVQERAKEEKAVYTAKLAGAGGDDDDAGDDVADDAEDAGGDSD